MMDTSECIWRDNEGAKHDWKTERAAEREEALLYF